MSSIAEVVEGLKFNRLTIIRRTRVIKGQHYILCKCECGSEKELQLFKVKTGVIKSCGCFREEYYSRKLNLAGNRYGRLVVLSEYKKAHGNKRRTYCICQCDCGNKVDRLAYSLYKKRTNSCGCFKDRNYKHGNSRKGNWSSEYGIYRCMLQRCIDEKCDAYERYGGRGITICERWMGDDGFDNFLSDMGRKPFKRASVDRIENSKGYSPSNCRWATDKEQARNTRSNVLITIGDEIKSLAEWCEIKDFSYMKAYKRIKRGWQHSDIFKTINR